MSRSYRKPYAAITGKGSAKQDKVIAARGVRRAQNRALRSFSEQEDFLLPHKLQCPWNNTYSWSRDGGKGYYGHWKDKPEPYGRSYYLKLCRK